MKRCRCMVRCMRTASLSPPRKDCSPDRLGLEYWQQRTAVPAGQDWQDNRMCLFLQRNFRRTFAISNIFTTFAPLFRFHRCARKCTVWWRIKQNNL